MNHRKLAIHYFLRSGLLAFFAYYILRLVRTDMLVYYIGPRMQLYVKLSAVGFYLLAVIQIYLALRTWWGYRKEMADCGCGSCSPMSSTSAGRGFFYILFAVPLALFLFLPEQALSSSLIEKKGISLTGAYNERADLSGNAGSPDSRHTENLSTPSPGERPAEPTDDEPSASAAPAFSTSIGLTDEQALSSDPLDALFPYDVYSEDLAKLAKKLYHQERIDIQEEGFIEIVSSIDYYMTNFLGKQVEMTGFVYREEGMLDNQFVVARIAVQCCAADSSPFGFMVESSINMELQNDMWVKVSGTLGQTVYDGNDILKIDATRIERVTAPASPYIFPDFNFFHTDIYD